MKKLFILIGIAFLTSCGCKHDYCDKHQVWLEEEDIETPYSVDTCKICGLGRIHKGNKIIMKTEDIDEGLRKIFNYKGE